MRYLIVQRLKTGVDERDSGNIDNDAVFGQGQQYNAGILATYGAISPMCTQ